MKVVCTVCDKVRDARTMDIVATAGTRESAICYTLSCGHDITITFSGSLLFAHGCHTVNDLAKLLQSVEKKEIYDGRTYTKRELAVNCPKCGTGIELTVQGEIKGVTI